MGKIKKKRITLVQLGKRSRQENKIVVQTEKKIKMLVKDARRKIKKLR